MIDPAVDGFVVVGIAQKDKVVDGDHGPDAGSATDIQRKLIAEAVVELHAVCWQLL